MTPDRPVLRRGLRVDSVRLSTGHTGIRCGYSPLPAHLRAGNKSAARSVLRVAAQCERKTEVVRTGKSARFEQTILPHLNAAYNLARWLLRNEDDAADAVQEACLRALKFFGGFRGGDGRTWLLTIVRNTCYTRLGQSRAHGEAMMFDEETHSPDAPADDPEEMLMRSYEGERLKRALEDLPAEFREVVILRELEGLSYKEIAGIADVPVGTVMSRLARARKRLQQHLTENADKGS